MSVFTILILPILSMGDPSIFYSLPQSLSSVVYNFPCRGLSHLLLSLFLGIFFEAIVNRIIFLYYFLVCSFLVYRKVTGFWKLILYPAICWSYLWCLGVFLVEFFQSFRYKIMSSANRNCLTSQICIPFVSSLS
jgi:hypothetical protein